MVLSEHRWAQAGGRQALGSAESALGKLPPELNLRTYGCLHFEKHTEALSPNVLLKIKTQTSLEVKLSKMNNILIFLPHVGD